MTVIYFLIALSILVLVHEWGHFIVARRSGIRVEKFSIGFGPKLWGTKRGDTEYKISALPFGGYVKMSGDDYENLDKNDDQAFLNKPIWPRIRVVAAGSLMNIILAVVLMPVVFMIGKSEPAFLYDKPQIFAVKEMSPAQMSGMENGDVIVKIGSKDVADWKDAINEILISANQDVNFVIDRNGEQIEKMVHIETVPDGRGGYFGAEPMYFIGNEAVIDDVAGGSPADKAGMKAGDKVIEIGGKKVKDWTDMVTAISQSEGMEISIIVDRNSERINLKIKPEYDDGLEKYMLGVAKDLSKRGVEMISVRYGFFESIKMGLEEIKNLAGMTFKVLGRLVTLRLSYKSLGGPIKIAQATAQAAQSGIASFLYFLCFLSLQLGILNLMPVPVLDGGHIVFFGIEAVRKKPVSLRVQEIAQQVGLTLIITLMVIVSVNDILDLGFVKNLINKFF